MALARALLSSRPIMLLDEPTAHLDIETEYELKETMVPLFEGKLVFLATHRLHWMLDMDIIVVMKQGPSGRNRYPSGVTCPQGCVL